MPISMERTSEARISEAPATSRKGSWRQPSWTKRHICRIQPEWSVSDLVSAVEKQEPTETPKQAAPESPVKAAPGTKTDNKADIVSKLNENATKTAPAKLNPLDKKDDDILKDIK